MSTPLTITVGKSKSEQLSEVEHRLGSSSGRHEKSDTYRFTAVLPANTGKRLRLHCARHNLRMKNVFADAIIEFLNKHDGDPTPQNLH